MDCHVRKTAEAVVGMTVEMPDVVFETLGQPSPPAFPEYSGGELQGTFIEQWRAVRAINERLGALGSAAEGAKGRLTAAFTALQGASAIATHACSTDALLAALDSGWSCPQVKSHWISANEWHVKCDGGASFSAAAWFAQKEKCNDATAALPAEKAQVVAVSLDAWSGITGSSVGMADAMAALARSGATIAQLLNNARLADARLELERKLTVDGLRTSFGLYRRYRSYDAWRAKALLEHSRRYGLAARRSIEAHYVVDLSRLTKPEAFVHSPSTWADEIYGYDLSLPAAVGLSVGTPQSGAIYPNKIRDYVTNLEAFVAGYSATRPAAVARDEIDLVNLKGLKQGDPVVLSGPGGDYTAHPETGEWSLRCPLSTGNSVWVSVPRDRKASEACLGLEPLLDLVPRPDRARLDFLLDPWGRLGGGVTQEPYQRRYNGRWGMLAVNFVGTGVKNCDNAQDPYACYSEGFIRYDLSHVGPAWITDYDGIWRSLGVPIGRIEGAKGLAAELWLDPLQDGWNTPYMSAVARTEMILRPLGGAYEMEFEIRPEIDIDRIDRVQLLIGSTYWVKQD